MAHAVARLENLTLHGKRQLQEAAQRRVRSVMAWEEGLEAEWAEGLSMMEDNAWRLVQALQHAEAAGHLYMSPRNP